MKGIFLGLVLGCAFSCATAATRVQTSTVHYLSGRDTVTAVLYTPDLKGRVPAVIVIHEWWGLNEWVKESAKQIASRGYVALAIDLYRGRATASPDEAHELMRGLPEDRALRDLKAADAYLRERADVDPARIGSVGWCMGGGYSLSAALNIPDLAGCVVCYGRLATDSALIASIPCPILGIFGEEDRGITPKDVQAFETACRDAGKEISVKEYAGAGHAFMNPGNKEGYRPAAAKDAWGRIYTFLAATLGKR